MIKSFNIRYASRGDLETVRSEVAAYKPANVLVQVFSGVLDISVIEILLAQMRELFPGVPIIGTSTAGEIADGKSLENTILISFTLFEQATVRAALVTQNDDLFRAGQDVATAASQGGDKAIIVLGCGLKNQRTINGEPLLDGVRSVCCDAVIAGGQAGDNGKGKGTFVFTNGGITDCGVVAATVAGSRVTAGNTYNLSWVPIGKKLTITAASGPEVYSIDGISPYDIYVHYLGQEVADGLPLSAADFPLIVERDGLPMAIHATGVNDDGSFTYIHNFYPGEQLRFGFCHAGLLALGAQTTHDEIKRFRPEAVFIYSCVSRKWILGADISVELSAFADLAPSAGFFCYGEYYLHWTGKPYFFSQTMTVLSLREDDGSGQIAADDYDPSVEESRQFRTMRVLHRLVDTSTREIEHMNVELARLASKDSLTTLANRRLFDETMERELDLHARSGLPFSILMTDIDCFKGFNDTYGHVQGDDCLRAISLVLGRHMKRPSDTVARYGGEEFACILPSTNHQGALAVAETIRDAVADLGIPHAASTAGDCVTISVGVLTLRATRDVSSEMVVAACDQLLYEAKGQGRNRVVGKEIETLA